MSQDQDTVSGAYKRSASAAILLRRIRHKITSTKARLPVVSWRHRGIRPADVILGSYPRSGSTWLRFTLFEILTRKPSSFDNVNAAFRGLSDYKHGWPLLPYGGRFVGSHEPYRNSYRKAVYLVRDVRDVALSEFAFEKSLGVGREHFDDYLNDLLHGRKRHGSWQNHVQSWIASPIARDGNLLLIRYEDLRRDNTEVFTKVVNFLGFSVDPKTVRMAVANNDLQRMREKENRLYIQGNYSSVPRRPERSVQPDGRFVRSGTVAGWVGKLKDAQLRLIEQYTTSVLLQLGYPLTTAGIDTEINIGTKGPSGSIDPQPVSLDASGGV